MGQAEVVVGAGSYRSTAEGAVAFPHNYTEEGVTVHTMFTGAYLLHLTAAGCVLNDVYRESAALGVQVDGVRIEGDFIMASVGNTRSYGGGIPICADADPSDGLLDVTLVRPGGRLRLLRLLPKVYAGAHMHDPQVQTLRGASIRMDAPGLQAYADGDPLGYLPLTIETWPAAQRVFVAPSS